jgi:hypothetical protein
MWNRKKFLIFALFLNCIYFIGTSVFVTRYVSKFNRSYLIQWVESGSQAVLDKITLDSDEREVLADELVNLDFGTKIKDWAHAKNITNLIEIKDETTKNWVGSRTEFPFNRNHLQNFDDIGFYNGSKHLNFNYLLQVKDKQFFATQQIDPVDLALYFEVYGMELTIVESDGENSAFILYTTLQKNTAHELLQKTPFDERQTMPEHMTLEKNSYVVQIVDLIPHGPLKQKIFFTKRIDSYKLLRVSDVLVFIWTFFCVSIALNVVLFRCQVLFGYTVQN